MNASPAAADSASSALDIAIHAVSLNRDTVKNPARSLSASFHALSVVGVCKTQCHAKGPFTNHVHTEEGGVI